MALSVHSEPTALLPGKPTPKYSICITTFNDGGTLSASIDSLLGQIDGTYEIVIVDSLSSDGSLQILQRYASEGQVKLVRKKCSRGAGRQAALENSVGEYIIADLDTDDVFRPELHRLLSFYHEACEGFVLLAIEEENLWPPNITIGPRKLILSLGGWRDLQWWEDWDLWRRAFMAGKFRWTTFSLAEGTNPHPERWRTITKLRQRYERYRDLLRLGRPIFSPGERLNLSQRAIAAVARASSLFHQAYRDGPGSFNPRDESLFIAFDDTRLPSSSNRALSRNST